MLNRHELPLAGAAAELKVKWKTSFKGPTVVWP